MSLGTHGWFAIQSCLHKMVLAHLGGKTAKNMVLEVVTGKEVGKVA